MHGSERRGRPLHRHAITPAEWRVLDLLRRGLTNKQIADRLDISPDGVKFHISNMLGKLYLESRFELAHWTRKGEGMMRFKSHRYRGHEDLETMVGLIAKSRRANGPKICTDISQGYFYLAHSAPSPNRVNPDIRLWTNESDEPVGYVWFDATYSSLQVHPLHLGSGVAVEMLDWLEDQPRASSGDGQSKQVLGHCFDNPPPPSDTSFSSHADKLGERVVLDI